MQLDLTTIPAIYINLEKDFERRTIMEEMLRSCGFKQIVRSPGVPIPGDPLAGCSKAHFDALGLLKPPFIVFEDDCKVLKFDAVIDIPDDTDALYLGNSSWARMNGHSGPFLQFQSVGGGFYRVYNMLGAHCILYLTEDIVKLYRKAADLFFRMSQFHDIGFADLQPYFKVLAIDLPMFCQTSSMGTDGRLTSYAKLELHKAERKYWLPVSYQFKDSKQ